MTSDIFGIYELPPTWQTNNISSSHLYFNNVKVFGWGCVASGTTETWNMIQEAQLKLQNSQFEGEIPHRGIQYETFL